MVISVAFAVPKIVSLPVPEFVATPTAMLYVAVDGATNSTQKCSENCPGPPAAECTTRIPTSARVDVFVTAAVSYRTRSSAVLPAVAAEQNARTVTRYRFPFVNATAWEYPTTSVAPADTRSVPNDVACTRYTNNWFRIPAIVSSTAAVNRSPTASTGTVMRISSQREPCSRPKVHHGTGCLRRSRGALLPTGHTSEGLRRGCPAGGRVQFDDLFPDLDVQRVAGGGGREGGFRRCGRDDDGGRRRQRERRRQGLRVALQTPIGGVVKDHLGWVIRRGRVEHDPVRGRVDSLSPALDIQVDRRRRRGTRRQVDDPYPGTDADRGERGVEAHRRGVHVDGDLVKPEPRPGIACDLRLSQVHRIHIGQGVRGDVACREPVRCGRYSIGVGLHR